MGDKQSGNHTVRPNFPRGKLGSYNLLHTLGVGGFGKVYLGDHEHLHTKAAVKVLHAELIDEQAKKFKSEAQMVAQLAAHPNIVRILEYNIQNGWPYIIMDYAAHGNLRQRHSFGQRVPLATVVSYVKQIAAGLQHAHDHGIVHCDVKPENMFLGSRDEVLIGDFGIAVMTVGLQDEQSQSEDTFGTMPYMAPEQISGDPLPASDQYATAIVVYEWLTGELPFIGDDKLAIMNKQLYVPPRSMRELYADIPQEVDQVVMKALTKDPWQRYSSIAAFAEALEDAYIQSSQTPTEQDAINRNMLPGQGVRPAQQQRSRRLWPFILIALATLLLGGMLVVALYLLSTVTVTITQTGLVQRRGYDVQADIGSSDPTTNAIGAQITSATTAAQSRTVPATGVQVEQAMQAYGIVTLYNSGSDAQTVPAGTIIAVPHSGLQIMTDEPATVPAASLPAFGQMDVRAHVVQTGGDGNIAPHTLNGTYCCASDTMRADNLKAFSGGQDRQQFMVVQQSDIDGAATGVEALQKQQAPALLRKLVPQGDMLIDQSVQCVPIRNSNAPAGSRVDMVTVNVTSSCRGVYYNVQALTSVGTMQFISYEDQLLGKEFVPSGQVKVAVITAGVIAAAHSQGRLELHVETSGKWLYNLNPVQQQALLQKIAGQSQRAARDILESSIEKPGVNTVSIQFTWAIPVLASDTLPGVNQIAMQVIEK